MPTQRQAEKAAAEASKASNAQASTTADAANQTAGAGAGGDAGKEKKPKPVKVFGGSSNFADLKKRESEVNTKYNRIARKIKDLGIPEEDQTDILDILKNSYEKALKDVFSSPASAASGAGESFV